MVVQIKVNQLFTLVFGPKAIDKTLGEQLSLSRNTLSQYRRQRWLTPQQQAGLFNRASHIIDRAAASDNSDDFPETAQAYATFRSEQKHHILNNWFTPGTYPIPDAGMLAYRTPHLFCLVNEWGWLGRPVSDFNSKAEFTEFARSNRFGSLVQDWLLDDCYAETRTMKHWLAIRRLVDAMILSAVIEDIECQVDGLAAQDQVFTYLDRLQAGEPASALIRESVHHFWQDDSSPVNRKEFIEQMAILEGPDTAPETVIDRIKRWQDGRQYITDEEMGRIAAIVGFPQLIPYLLVRLVEAMVLTTARPATEYLADYEWHTVIKHWRPAIHLVAMNTPGIKVPPPPIPQADG